MDISNRKFPIVILNTNDQKEKALTILHINGYRWQQGTIEYSLNEFITWKEKDKMNALTYYHLWDSLSFLTPHRVEQSLSTGNFTLVNNINHFLRYLNKYK